MTNQVKKIIFSDYGYVRNEFERDGWSGYTTFWFA